MKKSAKVYLSSYILSDPAVSTLINNAPSKSSSFNSFGFPKNFKYFTFSAATETILSGQVVLIIFLSPYAVPKQSPSGLLCTPLIIISYS